MKRNSHLALAAALSLVLVGTARAQDAKAVLDKAIKAAGGEEKLAKAVAVTWKTKGKFIFNDNESEVSTQVTAQGLDRYRSELNGNFNGNTVRGVTVVAGDKGWRLFREMPMELDADRLAVEKRNAYLLIAPATLVGLKGPGFKLDRTGEENVAGKPAAVLKVTGPEGKDFKLFFDLESGLPVKMTATVVGMMSQEYAQETTYANYKDFDGIKKATRIEVKRDGQLFQSYEVSDFKAMDKAPADSFVEPK